MKFLQVALIFALAVIVTGVTHYSRYQDSDLVKSSSDQVKVNVVTKLAGSCTADSECPDECHCIDQTCKCFSYDYELEPCQVDSDCPDLCHCINLQCACFLDDNGDVTKYNKYSVKQDDKDLKQDDKDLKQDDKKKVSSTD
ncbi:uncharacterized protein LOC111355850 [Spodoptera litura]|uniref:Uncharacterized protein LOC111355850 n=1 Tax=Spodoptera litura TaxID=69820 RepID=A0A9J7IWD8_SPOLT|nr:uncharacterized protein LOC111355850 [Spodoptera litura]